MFTVILEPSIMPEKHYHYKLDDLFSKGSMWKHRTLRTIFDPYSTEWKHTTIEQKLEVLEKILNTGYPLDNWLEDYSRFYTEELANKEHVVDTIDWGLKILYENATGDLKLKIKESLK